MFQKRKNKKEKREKERKKTGLYLRLFFLLKKIELTYSM